MSTATERRWWISVCDAGHKDRIFATQAGLALCDLNIRGEAGVFIRVCGAPQKWRIEGGTHAYRYPEPVTQEARDD